jgi:hypothetical protein
MSYKPGDPERKASELRAAIAAETMTDAEASDALFAWAQEVGLEITRSGATSRLYPRKIHLHRDGDSI